MSKKVLFLFFTEPNFKWVAPLYSQLQRDTSPELIPGFDYEVFCKRLKPWKISHPVYENLFQNFFDNEPPSKSVFPDSHLDSATLSRVTNAQEKALTRYLETNRPSLIVLPEDTDYARGRIAALVAKKMGIPTLVIHPLYYALFESYPLVASPLADYYAVLNTKVEAALIARGVPRTSISVTGLPELSSKPPIQRQGPCIYFLQGNSSEEEVAQVLSATTKEQGIQLWIKPHPRIPEPHWREQTPELHWLDSDVPLSSLWEEAGIAVGQSSATLVEALAHGLPSLFLHFKAGPSPVRLSPGVEHLNIQSIDDLRNALSAWKQGRLNWNTESFLGNGNASMQLREQIAGLISHFS